MAAVVIESPRTALERWRRDSLILPEKVTESLAEEETVLKVAHGQWEKFPSEEKRTVFSEREYSLKQKCGDVHIQNIEEWIIYAQK